MTTEATANPVSGSDSAQPSDDLNNPANWDFAEPELEQANENPEQGGTDPERETAAAESQEADESDQQEQDGEQDQSEGEDESAPVEVNVPDDALVTLPNGEKVKFADLKKGNMLERDYRHKTQELGNKTRALEATTNRINGVIEVFTKFLADQLPEEPSASLALQDPGEYTRRKVVHDTAMAQVQALIELGSNGKQVTEQLTGEQRMEALRDSNAKLIERIPDLKDPKKRDAFNQSTWNTAHHFGFTAEELNGTTDYRLLWMGHYAAKGLAAEQAAQKVAQKVVNAKPITPAKNAAPKGNPQFLRSKEAMRRLDKTGSIKDALAVDFD